MKVEPPIKNPEELLVGPQHIIFTERVDRTLIGLLRRSGGLVTIQDGMDSPAAVAAVELGLPAIIGARGNLDELKDGIHVILDANTGQLSEWKK